MTNKSPIEVLEKITADLQAKYGAIFADHLREMQIIRTALIEAPGDGAKECYYIMLLDGNGPLAFSVHTPAEKLRALIDDYISLKNRVKALFVGPFICGKFGKDQDGNTPEGLFICPEYGADVGATRGYWRDDVVKNLRAHIEAADNMAKALDAHAKHLRVYESLQDTAQLRIAVDVVAAGMEEALAAYKSLTEGG